MNLEGSRTGKPTRPGYIMMKSNVIFVCVEKFATVDHIIFPFFSPSVTPLVLVLRYFFFFFYFNWWVLLFYSQKQQKQKERKRQGITCKSRPCLLCIRSCCIAHRNDYLKQMLVKTIFVDFFFLFFRLLNADDAVSSFRDYFRLVG